MKKILLTLATILSFYSCKEEDDPTCIFDNPTTEQSLFSKPLDKYTLEQEYPDVIKYCYCFIYMNPVHGPVIQTVKKEGTDPNVRFHYYKPNGVEVHSTIGNTACIAGDVFGIWKITVELNGDIIQTMYCDNQTFDDVRLISYTYGSVYEIWEYNGLYIAYNSKEKVWNILVYYDIENGDDITATISVNDKKITVYRLQTHDQFYWGTTVRAFRDEIQSIKINSVTFQLN